MNNGLMTEKLLTAQDVAEKLSLSKRAVFRMKAAGLICPSVTVGRGAVRWRQSDIERWIAMGCCSRRDFEVVANDRRQYRPA